MKFFGLIFLIMLFALIGCQVKSVSNPVRVKAIPESTKTKILGQWELSKVVYYGRFEDNEQKRSFEFESNNFFTVHTKNDGSTLSKTNLYSAEGNHIKLINMDSYEVFEIMEIDSLSTTEMVLKSIYPEDLRQTIYAYRIQTKNFAYHEQ
jgi:hypothetical protein